MSRGSMNFPKDALPSMRLKRKINADASSLKVFKCLRVDLSLLLDVIKSMAQIVEIMQLLVHSLVY